MFLESLGLQYVTVPSASMLSFIAAFCSRLFSARDLLGAQKVRACLHFPICPSFLITLVNVSSIFRVFPSFTSPVQQISKAGKQSNIMGQTDEETASMVSIVVQCFLPLPLVQNLPCLADAVKDMILKSMNFKPNSKYRYYPVHFFCCFWFLLLCFMCLFHLQYIKRKEHTVQGRFRNENTSISKQYCKAHTEASPYGVLVLPAKNTTCNFQSWVR